MKLFITGATGFVGTHLVNRLMETEHELNCLVLEADDITGLKAGGAHFITGDVTDRRSLIEGMSGCDWVVNLANIYSFWEPDDRIYTEVNVGGTRNVMEAVLETGVSKVLHVSTSLVYGKPTDEPFTEGSVPGPVRFSKYAQSKYEGDQVVWELYEEKGLPVVMIYPASILGPGDHKASGQYVQDLIHRRLPASVFHDSVITFVHVRDVAEVIVSSLEKEDNLGEKYLVGSHPVTFREFNSLISEVSGAKPPKIGLPDWLVMTNALLLSGLARLTKKPPMNGMSTDQMHTMKEGFSFDGSKAERELGVTYTPIRKALAEAIASYQE